MKSFSFYQIGYPKKETKVIQLSRWNMVDGERRPRGVVAIVLKYDVVVSEFEL